MGFFDSLGSSAPDAAPAPVAPDNGQAAFNFFTGQGLTPQQASGIVGNLQGESGQGLNPTAVNKGDGRDGSDSIGIGQWNGSRAQALKDYAASKNAPWSDLNTQLEFLHSELKGPESAAYQKLTAAQTPEQAGQAMLAYERPKDWNAPGAHPERAQYAAKAFAAYGGGAQPPAAGPAPMNLAPPQGAPMFAQAQPGTPPKQTIQFGGNGAGGGAPSSGGSFQQAAAPQAAPIFASPRRPVDISKLRAAFGGTPSFFAKG